jgi:hypothetical protein
MIALLRRIPPMLGLAILTFAGFIVIVLWVHP